MSSQEAGTDVLFIDHGFFWSIMNIYRCLISVGEVEAPSSRSRSPIRTPPRLQLHRSAFLMAIQFVGVSGENFLLDTQHRDLFFCLCTSKNAFEWSPEHLPCIYEMIKKYQANRALVQTWHSQGHCPVDFSTCCSGQQIL